MTKIGDSLMKQFQEEIFLILQTDTPDAVKGKWRQRRGKIELDRQLNPEAHAAFDDQIRANKFLDYELARLRNCGELPQRGIYFSPDAPASWICSDIMIY